MSILNDLITFANAQQGAVTALATVAIASAAIVTTFLTFMLAKENRLLRKAGTEPQVVAYLTTNPRHRTVVDLVLANVGQGPAYNVKFTFEAADGDFAAHNVQISNMADRKPIGILPQAEQIDTFFGTGPDLFKNPRLKPFNVHVEYDDISGKHHDRDYPLDVSQFDGLITLGSPPEHEVAEALKKIERHVGQLATGFKRLKVETITTSEVRKQEEERAEQARAALETMKKEKQAASEVSSPNTAERDHSENEAS